MTAPKLDFEQREEVERIMQRSDDDLWDEVAMLVLAAAQLAEKEREMQKTIDLLDSQLGESMKETKAAEQRLQEAQARINYLENVKVRAGRGERSTS